MLKRLELIGFKSFAEKTRFDFAPGITAIVGPNGSGKSNIVDAVRWILGEQSAKSLRGGEMADVIFNGSSTRRSLGMAEVTMTFDNSRRHLAVDGDEVQITRRVYRDGQGEYLINGTVSRLRDIKELFLGTGAGQGAYSIIEQGRVDALLTASTKDRRLIFEEAAGISRFKAKKLEALRKLEATEQNLNRVRDILQELEKSLRTLNAQAVKARKYEEYQGKLKQLRVALGLREFRELGDTLAYEDQLLARFRGELAEAQEKIEAGEQGLLQLDADLAAAEEALRRVEHALGESRQTIVEQEAEARNQRERAEQLERDMEEQGQQRRDVEARQRALAEELFVARQAADQAAVLARDQQHRADAAAAGLQVVMATIAELQRQIQAARDAQFTLVAQVAQLVSAVEVAVGKEQRLRAELARKETERDRSAAESAAIERVMADLAQSSEELQARLAAAQARLEHEQSIQAARRREADALQPQLDRLRDQRGDQRGRAEVLEQLERDAEGVGRGVQTALARLAGRDDVPGMVADLIRVPAEFAPLVDLVLGEAARHLVILGTDSIDNSLEEILRQCGDLPGRVGLIPLARQAKDRVELFTPPDESGLSVLGVQVESSLPGGKGLEANRPPHPVPGSAAIPAESQVSSSGASKSAPLGSNSDAIPAVSQVPSSGASKSALLESSAMPIPAESQVPGLIERLLGSVRLVETLAEAQALRDAGNQHVRFITRQGELLEADGTVVVGPAGGGLGIVSRKTELRDIRRELALLEARIADVEAEQGRLRAEADALDAPIAGLQAEIAGLAAQTGDVRDALARQREKQERLEDLQGLLAQETALLARELQSAVEASAAARELAAAAEQQTEDLKADLERAESELRVAEATREERQQAHTQAQVALSESRQVLAASTARVAALEQETVQRQDELARLLTATEQASGRLAAARAAAKRALAAAAEASQRKEQLEGEIASLLSHRDDLRHQRDRMHDELRALRDHWKQFQDQAHAHELTARDLTNRRTAIAQRISEDYGLDLAGLNEADFRLPADLSDDDAHAKIDELRRKIARLGNVNLESLEQLAQEEARERQLRSELADLMAAERSLLQIIETINADSRRLFVETLASIRLHFQELFRKLFGGGMADIVLDDPAEVLESGIEITARPPGKELRSISLLSGGEKTLTALALLLAIFRSKPSPFCLLDEVDAALDEANTARLAAVLRDFLDQSQFIIITHKKRTMAMADVLYGITMQESGVSRQVATRIEDWPDDERQEHAA